MQDQEELLSIVKQVAKPMKSLFHHNTAMLGFDAIETTQKVQKALDGKQFKGTLLRPRINTRVYVGNLPASATEQDLIELLSDFGIVKSCQIPKQMRSKYCLVEMQTPMEAQHVLDHVNGVEWLGKVLYCKPDALLKSTSLFIGNLDFNVQWFELKSLLSLYGHTIKVNVFEDREGQSKGYAIALMASEEDALECIKNLDGYELCGRPMRIRMKGQQKEVKIYVGNLPYSMRWQDLKDLFRKRFHPQDVQVHLDPTGRSRGFGTLVLSQEEARVAIDELDGTEVEGRQVTVRLDRK
ncbi:hypothetical protein EDD86DRAFT_213142 [Gorgonomyces haynaldii]|nr:hypothetical protein EDD86DRAFT_213142 [Gorgonomyces haynaldii]